MCKPQINMKEKLSQKKKKPHCMHETSVMKLV